MAFSIGPHNVRRIETRARCTHHVTLHIRAAWHRGKAALTQTGLNGNENNGTLLPPGPSRALTLPSTTRKKLARKVCLPPPPAVLSHSHNPPSSLRSFFHYLSISFPPLSRSALTRALHDRQSDSDR